MQGSSGVEMETLPSVRCGTLAFFGGGWRMTLLSVKKLMLHSGFIRSPKLLSAALN